MATGTVGKGRRLRSACRTFGLLAFTWVGVGVLAACDGSVAPQPALGETDARPAVQGEGAEASVSGDAESESGPEDGSLLDGPVSVTLDGESVDGGSGDASADVDAQAVSGACNGLASRTPLALNFVNATAPTLAGGLIESGTYVATSRSLYLSSPAEESDFRASCYGPIFSTLTLQLASDPGNLSGQFDWAETQGTYEILMPRSSGVYSSSGASLLLNVTCASCSSGLTIAQADLCGRCTGTGCDGCPEFCSNSTGQGSLAYESTPTQIVVSQTLTDCGTLVTWLTQVNASGEGGDAGADAGATPDADAPIEAGGTCLSPTVCVDGAPCTPPSSPCHAGALSCATLTCQDQGTPLADGTSCPGGICQQGACFSEPCSGDAGTACSPSACEVGTCVAAAGADGAAALTCSYSGYALDGTACGQSPYQICSQGACTVVQCLAESDCGSGQLCSVPGNCLGAFGTYPAADLELTAGTAFEGTLCAVADSQALDTAGALIASIDWGDGETSAGVVGGESGNFTVAGAHTYLSTGSDAITVTVTAPCTQVESTCTLTATVQ